jgi:hypothetical protein
VFAAGVPTATSATASDIQWSQESQASSCRNQRLHCPEAPRRRLSFERVRSMMGTVTLEDKSRLNVLRRRAKRHGMHFEKSQQQRCIATFEVA